MDNTDAVAEIRELLNPTQDETIVEELEAPMDEVIEGELDEEATLENEEATEEATEEDEGGIDFEKGYSVKDLAEAIELEPADIYKMKIPLSDNAEPVELGTIKDTFQELNREKMNLEKEIESQRAIVEQAKSGINQFQQISGEMQQALVQKQMIEQQFNSIDWDEEERYDPGAAALKRQKLIESHNQAQYAINNIQQQEQYQKQQNMQNAFQEMYNLVPEWKDPAKLKEDREYIAQTLHAEGIPEQMYMKIDNPLLMKHLKEHIEMKRKLERYESQEKEVVEKVKKAPKVLRSKGRFVARKTADMDQAIARAKTTQNKHDEIAAVKAILANG